MASTPILWAELDGIATQLREGDVPFAIKWGVNGLMWWLAGFPAAFLGSMNSMNM